MNVATRDRRNIDSLSPEELAGYTHAIDVIRQISEDRPDSVDGYTYFEQLHDGNLGPCEHKNETFIPWHRAHLFLFEEALRRSDEPRTSNVTVPYWDWTALPSGKRFPKAFEDAQNIPTLFHEGRLDAPICRPGESGDCEALPFPRDLIEANALSKPAWSSDIAQQSHLLSFGGFAGGEQPCTSQRGKGYGALELPAHDAMHNRYIGGDMAKPQFAALDPIFFSFHCYIDLLWWQWQQVEGHETDTDPEARLCGMSTDPAQSPDKRFRVRDTLSIDELGYAYEPPVTSIPDERAVRSAPVFFKTHPALDFVASAHKEPELVRTIDVTIPEPGFERAHLLFTGLNVATPFSYGADVYLTPADEELANEDRGFRERHLADMLFFWEAHHHHGDKHTHDITVDLSGPLSSLARTHAGERWRVHVALAASEIPHGPHGGGGHEHAHAAADPAEAMRFDDLTLTIA